MEIFDTILPEEFKTWIQFYDHLCKEIPDLGKSKGEEIVKFDLPVDIRENVGYKYFVYKLDYIRSQCFVEIENFRPTEDDLYHYFSSDNGRAFPDEQSKKIDKLHELLLKY